MKKLITRADDFGASPGTNHAIVEALEAGYLRNVGLMAAAPCIEVDLDRLRRFSGKACFGLHSTLNSEWVNYRWGPVLEKDKVPSLVEEDGTFHRRVETTLAKGRIEEMLMELEAQFKRLQELDIPLGYFDSHMVVNRDPRVDAAFREWAGSKNLVYDTHVDFPRIHIPLSTGSDLAEAKQKFKNSAGDTYTAIYHPAKKDAVSELFYGNSEEPSTAVAERRDWEYRILTDPEFVSSFLDDPDICLSCYQES